MSAGRRCTCAGPVGSDGWVTPDTYWRMEEDGFSGRALERARSIRTGWPPTWPPTTSGWASANRELAWAHPTSGITSDELLELARRHGDADAGAADDRQRRRAGAADPSGVVRARARPSYAVDEMEREADGGRQSARARGDTRGGALGAASRLLRDADRRFEALIGDASLPAGRQSGPAARPPARTRVSAPAAVRAAGRGGLSPGRRSGGRRRPLLCTANEARVVAATPSRRISGWVQ